MTFLSSESPLSVCPIHFLCLSLIVRDTREVAPDQDRDPVSDPLREREPMQDIPHVITDMAESRDAANEACRRSHDLNQAPNPSRRKTHIEGVRKQ